MRLILDEKKQFKFESVTDKDVIEITTPNGNLLKLNNKPPEEIERLITTCSCFSGCKEEKRKIKLDLVCMKTMFAHVFVNPKYGEYYYNFDDEYPFWKCIKWNYSPKTSEYIFFNPVTQQFMSYDWNNYDIVQRPSRLGIFNDAIRKIKWKLDIIKADLLQAIDAYDNQHSNTTNETIPSAPLLKSDESEGNV